MFLIVDVIPFYLLKFVMYLVTNNILRSWMYLRVYISVCTNLWALYHTYQFKQIELHDKRDKVVYTTCVSLAKISLGLSELSSAYLLWPDLLFNVRTITWEILLILLKAKNISAYSYQTTIFVFFINVLFKVNEAVLKLKGTTARNYTLKWSKCNT